MASAPTARQIAAAVLVRVAKDSAFAAAVLDAELARAPQLEPRDRAFATELVYGSLRVLPWLEEQIARHATRGVDRTDARTRAEIALAAYQLFFSRVPAFAAVNEAVLAVRLARGVPVSRFANAILRKLAADAEAARGRDLGREAAWASTPEWLRAALARALGADDARAFLEAGTTATPPVCLRVERASARDAVIDRVRGAAPLASVEPGALSPHAVLVRGAGDVRTLPGYAAGEWSVQEEGSQVVALAPGARPGEIVLDACAGRGNKAAVLARAVGERGALDAADAQPDKLERLARELGRVGLAARATYAVDWSVGAGDVEGLYDRVLVDAPCSGTGTIRRRPEILTRRSASSLTALADLQVAIATRAASRVRPGGALVYAVCSVLREEAEDVVERLLAAGASLEPAALEGAPASELAGPGATTLRLLPHVHGTDGYFLASFRKKE